ncbi:MAG: radical SAM protein [Planctomycetota bacterium]
MSKMRALWQAFRHPVHPENRANLKHLAERLPEKFRTPQQMYGLHGEGCAATMGAMPRCDFACRGCYLGEDANQVPAQSLDDIKAQMRVLRQQVGRWGNLQLTDGEVTLRPAEDLIELLCYAREIELLPMLMTHGDTFRRQPDLLERLVEAGLREVSIHVDTTQRGRRGDGYRFATREEQLHPLRDEFAAMVRAVRQKTGKPLRAATTMTITAENLVGVATVCEWMVRNADAFCLISFQPIAQVGRTEDGLGGGASVDDLWREVSRGVYGDPAAGAVLDRGSFFLGHPGCTKYVTGGVATASDGRRRYLPVRDIDHASSEARLLGFFRRWGGITFRQDRGLEIPARVLGMVVRTPLFFLRHAVPYAWHWLRRIDGTRPLRGLADLLRKKTRLHGLMFASHHFMSRQEIETPLGKERLDLCIFHTAVGDRIVSMCEANALGVRDQYYEDLMVGRQPQDTAPQPVGTSHGSR